MSRRLMNLLASVAKQGTKPTIKVEANGDEATLYIDDVIDAWFGIAASDVAKALAGISAKTIHVRINSPGGDVFEARAIKTHLEQHSARIIAHIDGVAASAASFIMLAADEIEIASGAFIMVHNAWTFAVGNAADLRQTAELLDKVDASIADDYRKKTGASAEKVAQWMADETWFTAQEALDAKLVDRIYEKEAVDNRFDFSAYAKTPEKLTAKAPPAPTLDELAANLKAAAERKLSFIERTAA